MFKEFGIRKTAHNFLIAMSPRISKVVQMLLGRLPRWRIPFNKPPKPLLLKFSYLNALPRLKSFQY